MDAAEWAGSVGGTWAAEWRRTDRSFAGLDPALERAILAAAPAGDARLVEIGCGAGTTGLAIAAALPRARLIGIDISGELVRVAEARARAAGSAADRIRYIVGDAADSVAPFAPVDLFFSRHGVMFFTDPIDAFSRLRAAAASGARLVFSCFAGLADNPWATEPTGGSPAPVRAPVPPGPFAFADPDRVATILAAAGWRAPAPERVAFRYVAGAGDDPVGDAASFFRRIGPAAAALRAVPEGERPALLDRLTAACALRLDGGEVAFPAAAWLWSATAAETAR